MKVATLEEIRTMTDKEQFFYFLKDALVNEKNVPEGDADILIDFSGLSRMIDDIEYKPYVMHYDTSDWADELIKSYKYVYPAAGTH